MIDFVLLLAAFILFVLSALGVSASRVNLLAAGLACWVLVLLIKAWPG
jgi:hypothetical protein